MQFRYPGKGNFGPHRGPPGDLRVTVSVQPDRFFERKGADVYVEVPVTITQAILGGTIEVPTLKGEVNVKIPPGTQPGEKRVMRNKGIKYINSSRHGDQYITFNVHIPKNITDEQRDLLEKFSALDKQATEHPKTGFLRSAFKRVGEFLHKKERKDAEEDKKK